jgi:hypothetical protein
MHAIASVCVWVGVCVWAWVCGCVGVGVWGCECVGVGVCVCVGLDVCVCVSQVLIFEPGDQVSQKAVRPLPNAMPINDNSTVGTPTFSLDRQLTYVFRWPIWLSRLLVLVL